MRKAKVAAFIIGGVSTCIFGGALSIYTTAPTVSSVAPINDFENIYEVKSEELVNVAAVTSIRTTPQTTTSNINFSYKLRTTAVSSSSSTTAVVTAVTTSITTADALPFEENTYETTEIPEINYDDDSEDEWLNSNSEYDFEYEYEYGFVDMAAPVSEDESEKKTEKSEIYETPVEEATAETETEPLEVEPETEFTEYEEEVPTEEYVEETEPEIIDEISNSLPVSDEDYIILCNAVAHEAGCAWISVNEKALVVEVIMNRVYSSNYPNSIAGVLSQPNQFTGSASYLYLGKFSSYVNQDVEDAIALYFNNPDSFSEGYIGFYGDGYRNYFY